MVQKKYGNCMIKNFFKKFLWKKKLWTINSTAGKTFKRFWAATTEIFDVFNENVGRRSSFGSHF